MEEGPGTAPPGRRARHRAAAAVPADAGVPPQGGVPLAGIRHAVFDALHRAGRPLGAYEIIGRLAPAPGQGPKPQTIYRCLDFLMAHGFVSRVESWNAYVSRGEPGTPQAGLFLLCGQCGTTITIPCPELDAAIDRNAATVGFHTGRRVLEVQGVCAACAEAASDAL